MFQLILSVTLILAAAMVIALPVEQNGGSGSSWCGIGDVIPNYATVNVTQPKRVIPVPQPHRICVAQNGRFAVISFNSKNKFRIFDPQGDLIRTAVLPPGSQPRQCSFGASAIYISDLGSKRLLKYTINGDYLTSISDDVFFYDQMVWCKGYLFVTIPPLKVVAVFYNDKEIERFNITNGKGGLSFDRYGNLYIADQPKKIQVHNSRGKEIKTLTFKEVGIIGGFVVDYGNSYVIADYMMPANVLVYSPFGVLVKRLDIFSSDVAIGVDGTLLITSMVSNKVLLF